MGGLNFWPKMRITPSDGVPTELDLLNDTTWIRGPIEIKGPRYIPLLTLREDAELSLQQTFRGWRVEVGFVYEFGGELEDYRLIDTIENAMTDRTTIVALTLNFAAGDQAIWRRMMLLPKSAWERIANKDYAGIRCELYMQAQKPITRKPNLSLGEW